MRKIFYVLTSLLLFLSCAVSAQKSIWFLNTTERLVHLQKRTVLEIGFNQLTYPWWLFPLLLLTPDVSMLGS